MKNDFTRVLKSKNWTLDRQISQIKATSLKNSILVVMLPVENEPLSVQFYGKFSLEKFNINNEKQHKFTMMLEDTL